MTQAIGFQAESLKEVETLFKRYPQKIHALLPILHLAQRENGGWLPEGWDAYVAGLCETTTNHVRGVITFYNMFKTRPVGKYHLMVCTCLPCGLCGGKELLHALEKQLDIVPGQVTSDGLFSLEEAQCLAACDKAPLMLVNEDLKGALTLKEAEKLIKQVRLENA